MRRSLDPSSGLSKLQGWFFAQLQPGARRAVGPVVGTPRLSGRARMEVYADMYLARLVDALGQEYPRLAVAMGGERFGRVAAQYLKRFPSRQPTIQDVGDRFPGFLKRELKAGKLRQFPYAADLAELEDAGNAVYLAADGAEQPLEASVLRSVAAEAWPGLRFRVTSTLRLVKLGYKFPRSGKPVKGTTVVRLHRQGLDVYEAPMDVTEARALSLVQCGQSFGEVCLALGDAQRAATALATWVDEGLLAGLY